MELRACCHSPDIYKNKIWPLPWQVYNLMPCLFQNSCAMLYRLINLSDFNETVHLCKVRLCAGLCRIWT